ncbi:neo-calmodulin [Exaiptasia diaphana]|uniref:EF-hand domain-containing protein n=1 Tax=Exaiptasia diaphana TaxID=2652724 RepID=A0A913XAC7_EXADI|nr:neo-calmodulin [Exaiptasia diaphana]
MERFSASEIDELKECFSLYDGDSDGMIGRRQLESVMRSLGEPVTYSELDQMANKFGPDKIRFPDFLKLLAEQRAKNIYPKEEILHAFDACDKKKSRTISRAELQHFMVDTGEKMTQQEFEEMLRACGMGNSQTIKYQDLVQAVMQIN